MTGSALLVAVLAALTAAAGETCAAPRDFTALERLEVEGVVVLFRTQPATIEVGQYFTVEAIVCTPPAGPPAASLRVDARMPEHRHGMNYRPRVVALAASHFMAEGLLFHMPGRWQLTFDVDRGDRSNRLTADLVVQ